MATILKNQQKEDSAEEFIASWPDEQAREGKFFVIFFQRQRFKNTLRRGTRLIGFGKYTYHYVSESSGDWKPTSFAPRNGGMI